MSAENPSQSNPYSSFSLQDKVAIVTGAASGIGKATAKLFAAVGAKVVIADLNLDGAQTVADDITAAGGTAMGIACDLGKEADILHLFQKVLDTYRPVDVLVNNAALRPKADFMEMSADQWDQMHAVNTRGPFLTMREAIRHMKSTGKGGSIVNVSTIGTLHPTIFNNTHYDSSKAGVNALTRTSAVEFAPDNIRVNAVLPGGTDTEGSRTLRASGLVAKGPIVMPGRIPMARVADPSELANAILFLASPASSYITGHLLPVDGGYLVG